ncbi:hypothetical protein A3840_13640 [Devosia elaeis]|uniref:AAA+ ATPase domain-containing protein n=2 Tax=Devosia elaeis TaxID=1770058 RepID=A0A178HTQ4_9HYPH|nr:hypothetical protein A3840_13640 [Devosia elaeis]
MSDDIRIDARSWCEHMLSNAADLRAYQSMVRAAGCAVNFGRALRALRASVSLQTIKPVELAARSVQDDDAVTRMLVYRSCLRDEQARRELSLIAGDEHYRDSAFTQAQRHCVALGLLHSYSRPSMRDYHAWGRDWLSKRAAALEDLRLAAVEAETAAKAKVAEPVDQSRLEVLAAVRGVDPADEDFIRAVLEDRVEFWSPNVREIVVVPAFPEGGTSHRKDLQKGWAGMDGQALPVVLRGDVAAHREALVDRWPHAADVIDVVLGDLALREEVKFRPTLFVGPPGSGKSSLARAICDQIGLPNDLYNLAGMADSSLVGTSAQWSTARECVPLQVIKRAKSASVAVVWDEVEKASTGSQNGSPLDAMLPLLEADQAKRFRDLALEAEVNLSFVSHFATANSLDGIPAPLRDRMRILVMPEPTWAHLGVLSRQIVDRIARERGVDRRWFADLAEDEMDLVRQAWPGGSLRQLTRIITTLVDGRELIMGRC